MRRAKRLAAPLVLACLSATLLNGTASAAGGHTDQVAAGSHWSITRVAGGFRVTLDLDRPLPVTASAPSLAADGQSLGPATESADGRSLSLVTTDASVLTASSVTTDATVDGTAGASAPEPTAPDPTAPGAGADRSAPQGTPKVLPVDPSTPGPHRVAEAVYDFGDQAIPLLNIGGIRGELEGKIYLPDGGGRHPVVIFEHGRHSSCYGSGKPNPAGWPCLTSPTSTEQRFPIPSFLGYDAPARALASDGYVVVSISANAINASDNQLAADYGAQARGELILDTLRMLKKADAGAPAVYHDAFTDRDVNLGEALNGDVTPADLIGRFNFGDVGIMGHSRGGEGVVAASTLNDALPVAQQFGIRAVLPLAPVDYDRISLPNVATATVLPYCDGDVENLMGQHIVDDSRHAFADNVLRSAVLVMGANHNYFNTIWTPGGWPSGTSDDWAAADGADDPVCDPSSTTTTRLSPTQQVAVETAYVAGFFRLTLGNERQFQPLFDGSAVTAPSTAFAHITTTATQPAKSRVDINTFERSGSGVRVLGDATAHVCASMGGSGGVELPQAQPFCTTTLNEAAVPHWSPAQWAWNDPSSPMLHLTWASRTGQARVTVPPAARDVRGYDQISVKVAADEFVSTGTDLTITVVDGSGRTWSAPVSALNPQAVTRMPGVSSPWLRKVILQQVTIPTSALAGINRRDVREVRFTGARGADGTDSGGVYLSDLSLEDRAVGARVPAQQATVNVAAARVEEGSGPGTARVAAVLSRRVDHPVTADVSVFGSATGKAGVTMRQVTFAPGQVCVPVTVPTYGDALPSATASTSFKVSATDVTGAVMGDHGFGTLTVREDDGVTGGTPAPEVGVAGDPCREYAASLTPGRFQVTGTVAGATTTLRGSGYRAGESVEFTLGATSLGRAVADGAGRVRLVTTIPADTPSGTATFTATGAGSGYVTKAIQHVRSAH
ncbi:alpha/beta hydrolase [Rugosimonospora acidiphila]